MVSFNLSISRSLCYEIGFHNHLNSFRKIFQVSGVEGQGVGSRQEPSGHTITVKHSYHDNDVLTLISERNNKENMRMSEVLMRQLCCDKSITYSASEI